MPCAARRRANGSFDPDGIRPTRKQPRSVSSLSAIETQLAGEGAGNGILHADRFVVVVDRDGDFFGFALGAGVESADDALEFGEFLDEFGGEVGFAKAARPVSHRYRAGYCLLARSAQNGAKLADEEDHAAGLLEIGAELGLEGDVARDRRRARRAVRF